MKICRICQYYPSLNDKLGGAASGLRYITEAQSNLGHDLTVITSKSISKNQTDYEKIGNIKIHRVFASIPGPLMPNYWAFGFNAMRKFRKLNKENNFDLVHAHDRETFLFDLINKIFIKKPLFLRSHGLIMGWKNAGIYKNCALPDKIEGKARLVYERIAIKQADFIFVGSEYAKKEINEMYGINLDRIHVLMNGCDTDFFKPMKNELRKELGLKDSDFAILLPATTLMKGFGTFIKSIAQIISKYPQIKVIALGSKKYAEKYIPQKLKHVFLLQGQVNYNKMPEYFNACDLFLLPTIYEGMPKSLLEAMSCEKPVLSTNVCGISEIIKDGENGFLSEVSNPEKLSDKISFIIENPEKAKLAAKKGRELILKEYTWKRFAERIDDGYKIYFEKFGGDKKK